MERGERCAGEPVSRVTGEPGEPGVRERARAHRPAAAPRSGRPPAAPVVEAAHVHGNHRRGGRGDRGRERGAAHPRAQDPVRRQAGRLDCHRRRRPDGDADGRPVLRGQCDARDVPALEPGAPEAGRQGQPGALRAADRPPQRSHRPRRRRRPGVDRVVHARGRRDHRPLRDAAGAAALHGGEGAGGDRRREPDDHRQDADSFAVSLVQYTQEHTGLLAKKPGDSVNIETDIIARYVETLLEARAAEG